MLCALMCPFLGRAALCALRPDRAIYAAHVFISTVLKGPLPTEAAPLSSLFKTAAPQLPLLIIFPHPDALKDALFELENVCGPHEVVVLTGKNDDDVSASIDQVSVRDVSTKNRGFTCISS